MKNLLSVVINCKNDNYHSNFINRLEDSLNLNLFILEKIGERKKVKFNIVDWGSEKPLSEEIKIYSSYKDNLDFYNVSKDIANESSKAYPGNFNVEISGNLGFRKSNSEFILYTGSDQIFSKSSWLNIINLLEGKNKPNYNLFDTVFYIPRKFIDIDFYRKDPSLYIYERYFDFMNFSALEFKTPTFYVGGGYSTLCSKKIIEQLKGFDENYGPGIATDLDFHTRINRLSINQVDTSQFGITMFKFPSEPDSVRHKLLYETKLTRNIPYLKKEISPNDESWGLKNYEIKPVLAKKNSDIIKESNQLFFISKYKKKLSFREKIKLLFFSEKFMMNSSEWNLIFFVSNIIKSIRVWSLIECGFNNINRPIILGQAFKFLEMLNFDNKSLIKDHDWKQRLLKVQVKLSNNRHGKFTSLNSSNFDEFTSLAENIPQEKFSSIFLLNFDKIIDSSSQEKLVELLKDKEKLISLIIITKYDKKFSKNLSQIEEKYKFLIEDQDLRVYINNKIPNLNNESNKIQEIYQNTKDQNITIKLCYLGIFLYKFLTSLIKKIHYSIFKFKY